MEPREILAAVYIIAQDINDACETDEFNPQDPDVVVTISNLWRLLLVRLVDEIGKHNLPMPLLDAAIRRRNEWIKEIQTP